MFRLALNALLLELACPALAVVESEQKVAPDEVSLIQLGQTATRRKGMASQADTLMASYTPINYTQLAAQFAEFKASRGAAALQVPQGQTASFISADSRLCFEGTPRATEGALALKKASPLGRLYDNMYAAMGTSCSQRGYLIAGGVDHCNPDVNLYLKAPEDGEAFTTTEVAEMASYGQRFNHDLNTVHLMIDCTCHTHSEQVTSRGSQCDALNSQPGAWIHHDPENEEELMCDEGPFVLATLAMAVLKSSGQLPMHIHDTVSATSCASMGFPEMYPPEDHCFPPMRIWTRTNIYVDAGVKRSQVVESDLFGGGFESYFSSRGISVNVQVLTSIPGCHCMRGSEVYESFRGSEADCTQPENHPPVSDWWTSPWTSPWPTSQ